LSAPLYLDEDITDLLAQVLRARGYDVVSTRERNAGEFTDDDQLDLATSLGRAILTCNARDFVRISRERAASAQRHAGIIISYEQIELDQVRRFADAVARLLDRLASTDLANNTLVLQDFM
jgi:uncharacterized protein with PIN domain